MPNPAHLPGSREPAASADRPVAAAAPGEDAPRQFTPEELATISRAQLILGVAGVVLVFSPLVVWWLAK